MGWWQDALDSLVVLVLVPVALMVYLFVRRRFLSHSGATFECSVRMNPPNRGRTATTSARGWTLGLARYDAAEVRWFRVFSFAFRPKYVFDRSLRVTGRRTPHGAEAFSLYSGHVVVSVLLAGGKPIELAMSEQALTGFLAWTEAAPPGHDRLLS
ncbi:MAG: DUF2550 domain-containing protein [Nocardioidaceae bacterium]